MPLSESYYEGCKNTIGFLYAGRLLLRRLAILWAAIGVKAGNPVPGICEEKPPVVGYI